MEHKSPMIHKEKLVEKYIPLVKYLASRIMIGKMKYIEYEDLVGYGIVGLLDAINRYDSSKGMKFSSYATLRIKGSMIDEIRKNRPISKGAMDKLAKYNESVEKLQNKLMREPSLKEIAIDLNISEEEVSKIENSINYMSMISLESVVYSDDDDITIMETLEDRESISPESSLEDKEKLEILSKAIDMLKEKDKLILKLYYYERLTLKEIGQVLEVSESRVCQLHSRAIRNLRAMMQKIKYI
ncbi:FliA/WhiG family RNA polymerase sigma factor [Clostridium sp. Sa3CUN1]|uniref:FliA/WhiG family RNA polymerase sigma factor n=1 Tax=Clostridium gallinarum TaxID=2762246 RepID=A0ABR8Q4H1_9CLOT|nr:FliA/WhiG family RNA polymerase sigma factor [Clostridium gallinarum]MBD7915308.1 FliA/WhiG family RNA polymerase sigma factor [Clostridium gallinarum]